MVQWDMSVVFTYRHRAVTADEVQFFRDLIAAHPGESRRQLSIRACQRLNWRQPNGVLCDSICRSLMLELDRAGHIRLPPVKQKATSWAAKRSRPHPVSVDRTPVCTSLRGLGPLRFEQVRRTQWEALFNWLLESEHPLGYCQPVGQALKFLVFAGLQPVALFAWSSAPRHLGPRDRYIGWSPELRLKNIRYVAYQTRYLIPSWVRVPHLASHLLSRMTRMLPAEWEKVYGHPVYFAETFVDPATHRGTCYRAANWVYLGRTQGLGKDSRSKLPNRSIKEVLGMPLMADFRQRLTGS
jgi:Domain of unknown function (DUF4338)